MEEIIKRIYTMEDEALITRAKTTRKFLEDHLGAFAAKFSWIDASFVTAFEADILAADNALANQLLAGNKKVMTEDVSLIMEQGFAALHVLGTYAGLAYPKDQKRRMVFGQEAWRAARYDRKKMFDVLVQAHSLASQDPYKTDLGNKGFTPADENLLRDLADLLDEKKIPQLNAGKEKRILTADRILLYNKVFETMKTLKLCARLVFRNDYALRKVFNLYPSPSKSITTLKVLVVKSELPFAGAEVKLAKFGRTRLTDKNGTLSFRGRKMPSKIEGEVNANGEKKAIFSVEIKSGKRNKVVVELAGIDN
jgi:hypothetical protein